MAFTISSLVWLILLIAFVVVEALTVSLVSIWFAAGAVAALIVSGFTSSWL
ncbi:MAG TPA: NfeD family protein, partial [Ruthenibacterium lactatiformans]|nr:NfeD family protein [Ruthenibacterium lactatiformans]